MTWGCEYEDFFESQIVLFFNSYGWDLIEILNDVEL